MIQTIPKTAPLWANVSVLFTTMLAYLTLALYATQNPSLRAASFVLGTLMATCAGLKCIDWKNKQTSRSLDMIAATGMALVFLLALPTQIF